MVVQLGAFKEGVGASFRLVPKIFGAPDSLILGFLVVVP